MENLNEFINQLADEGSQIRRSKTAVAMDAMPERIQALIDGLKSRRTVEQQREACLKYMALLLGLGDNPEFADWLNS